MGVLEDFRLAIQTGKSDRVDFVKSVSEPRFAQTICAFANTNGGTIFIGVQQTPDNASPSDAIQVSVPGTDAWQAIAFLANVRNFFDDPLPDVRIEEVDHKGPSGPVMAAHVARRNGSVDIALSDLTVWNRKGTQNESYIAKTHPVRPKIHEARAEGGLSLSGSAVVEFHPASSDGGGKKLSEEGRAAGEPSNEDLPGEDHVVEILSNDSAEGSDHGNEREPSREPAPRLGGDTRFRRESDESELSLNADDYADVIARLLSNADNEEKMTFALLGHWGRGKTYLANRIRGKLANTSRRYSTILFSAWKYRTTPEVWAYLFQQFMDEGKQASFGIPFRAVLVRTGPWPLIIALLGLLLSIMPLGDKVNLFASLVQLFGFATILYVGFLLARFRSTALRLKTLYSFTGHAEKLGLQAAIGDDLRALLMAWIPRIFFKVKYFRKIVLPGLIYIILACLISWRMWPFQGDHVGETVKLPVIGNIPTGVDPYIALVLYAAWLLVWIGGLILVVPWNWRSTARILLVIDDLDRCEPKQMLEIIESVLLILDDPEISSRLQIVMLIDESAFNHALMTKYHYLTVDHKLSNEHVYTPRRIVRENQEKFFLAHLHLPRLSQSEINEVTDKFVRQLSGVTASQTTINVISPTIPAPELNVNPRVVEQPNVETPRTEPISPPPIVAISSEEVEAIRLAIKKLAGREDRDPIGPRAIRCLLFRYQLARDILIKLNSPPHPGHLAERVVEAHFSEKQIADGTGTILGLVVQQVS